MIPNILITRLKMLTESAVRASEPVVPVDADPPLPQPGERFRALILSALPQGTYRAEVQGRTLTLALPTPARPGDELELVATAAEPGTAHAAERPAITARLAEPPPSAPATPAPQLSSAAKLIGTLLKETPAKPVTLAGGAPLTAMPGAGAERLAPLLRDALASSGVFYESHQARWVEGRTTLDALRMEPQARLPAGFRIAAPQADADDASPAAAPASASAAAPADDVTAIMHKQLDTLANQQLGWQVQLWPGQFMDWEIDAPPERDAAPDDESETPWKTRLRLTLPQLGEVAAELSVAGSRIGIRLHAQAEDGAARLRAARPVLARAFEAAGLQLIQATVDRDD